MNVIESKRFPHIILSVSPVAEKFKLKSAGGNEFIPSVDREVHAAHLLKRADDVQNQLNNVISKQKGKGITKHLGAPVQFISMSSKSFPFDRMRGSENSGVELYNVQVKNDKTIATYFIPNGDMSFLVGKINKYRNPEYDTKSGKPSNNALIGLIEDLEPASLESLWTDDIDLPNDQNSSLWWEVWVSNIQGEKEVLAQFRNTAASFGIKVSSEVLSFPERSVINIKTSRSVLADAVLVLNSIAEIRSCQGEVKYLCDAPVNEQKCWANDLLSRTEYKDKSDSTPYICILDTGVDCNHPLICKALAQEDLYSICCQSEDGPYDIQDSHGTQMAGLSLYGNLVDAILSNEKIIISHRLESVQLIGTDNDNKDNYHSYGGKTLSAVSKPITKKPQHRRIFSMAVTYGEDGTKTTGKPTSWSATIDNISFQSSGELDSKTLFIVSAGNILETGKIVYPESSTNTTIKDPAQAWNALTVGAMTNLVECPDKTYEPVAQQGGLCPFTTSSFLWDQSSLLKPDVLFEGGNLLKQGDFIATHEHVGLLTTTYLNKDCYYTTTNATSAASALCARMAAQIMDAYPALWPESIRALIVHSARWTKEMMTMFQCDPSSARKKEDVARLIRHCGYGEPSLQRALWSSGSSLVVISQQYIQPFVYEDGKVIYNNIHYIDLPWPTEELEKLGAQPVEMKVTLSYFIEPNPSSCKGDSYRKFESFAFKFDVKKSTESITQFKARLNAASEQSDSNDTTTVYDKGWQVGSRLRNRGSISNDIWTGTAADLATRNVIAVYPQKGWWKTLKKQNKFNQKTRYSLIVSISTPEVETMLYTKVKLTADAISVNLIKSEPNPLVAL